MATIAQPRLNTSTPPDERTYQRRIWAWTLYDWAHSAFFITVLSTFLPTYFSDVAGSTLASRAQATQFFSISLSVGLLIAAVLSPILGTLSDVARAKKPLLAIATAVGVLVCTLLVFVGTGDWVLALVLNIVGRVAVSAALVFYDALLPHVARPDDRDRVSARGYAVGFLGGGILLAFNVGLFALQQNGRLPRGLWGLEYPGVQLSFLSVGLWWAVFALPLFRVVPEPRTTAAALAPGQNVLTTTLARTWATLRDMRRYPDLLRYLIAFLIYNDGIGTVTAIATLYGRELNISTQYLILAQLVVQFVGIPFSLLFGNLSNPNNPRRHQSLAFLLFNVVALVTAGAAGRVFFPQFAGLPGQPVNLPAIALVLGLIQAGAAAFALLAGNLLRPISDRLDTRRTILLGLGVFIVLVTWGFTLGSTLEFWCLAWMLGLTVGGTQALSRSLFSKLAPDVKSGEFFGLFAVMDKFASVIGPLLFAATIAVFGSSRPAVLSLALLFLIGGGLLVSVNVARGRALAEAEDAALQTA